MFTSMIEAFSLLLFAGCLWHATRYYGRLFAQMWFISAYFFALMRETVMQVVFITYYYAPGIVRLGAAPAFVSLLWGSLIYLAFTFAQRFVPRKEYVPFTALVFIITASLALPIQATGVQLQWWRYEEPSQFLFAGLPLAIPLIWGAAAAIFYPIMQKVTETRLRGQGQLYAAITLSPVIAALHVIVTLLLSVFF